MKLIVLMVASLDGRTTKGKSSNIHNWTSEEDNQHFIKTRDSASLIIMGSNTYESAKSSMEHKKERLRIVMTRTPEKYENDKIPGRLEFTNENPKDLLERLEKEGHTKALLVGGAHANTEFFKQNLVTELWQTIEPKILGDGNGIIAREETEISLELLSSEKLNDRGTLLLKYKVV